MNVDFHGVTIDVPDEDQAKALIAARDQKTKEFNDLKGRVDSLAADAEAQRGEALAKAQEAEAAQKRAEALEAAKKGDVEAAEALLTEKLKADHKAEIGVLQASLMESTLTSAIAQNASIAPDARADVQKLIMGTVALKDGKIVPLGDNGEPVADLSLSDHVSKFVEARPHYRLDKLPTGDGSNPVNSDQKQTVTRAEYDAGLSKTQNEALANGTLTIVD